MNTPPLSENQQQAVLDNLHLVWWLVKKNGWTLPGIDAREEGYLCLCQAIGGYDPNRGTLKGYLTRCLENRFISLSRMAKKRNHQQLTEDTLTVEPDIAENLKFQELVAILLKSCKTPRQTSIIKASVNGTKDADIAKSMGIQRGSVANSKRAVFARFISHNK